MANQMKDCGSVGVVTIPERVDAVLEAKEKLTSLNRELGERLKVVVTPSLLGEEPELPGGTVSYTQLSTQKLSTKLPTIDTDGIAFIPYSSGTTGLPKGVCLTHKNIVSNLVQLTHEEICDFNMEDSTSDVVPVILPMFHIYGLVIIAMQVLSSGSKLVTLPRFEPTFFLNIMKEQKATVLFAAPPLLLYLGASPDVTKEHLAHLRLTVSGAAPIAKSDIEVCAAKSPKTNIFKQGYGLTECSPGVSYSTRNYTDYNSVGKPVPNTEMKVVDVVTGEALPPNQNGEICVRGPQVMKGYLNNPKATAECIDKDGWFHTGDTGYYTEDKNFYIVDRVKELIKVKGFQVAPAELEEVLRTHPAIKDAGVIGIEEKRMGERPIAFVSLHSKKNPPKEEELKEFIKEKVAPYKKIETFIFIDNIERSPAGKVLRKDLKQLYLEMQDKS